MMAEPRLIDSNALCNEIEDELKKHDPNLLGSRVIALFAKIVAEQPEIDPETLPIVRELREKLMLTEANQQHFKEERDEFEFKMREVAEAANAEIDRRNKTVAELREKLEQTEQELRNVKCCYDIAKNGEKQLRRQVNEVTAEWAECVKKLERVTAERDAAVERLQKTRTVVSQENEMGNYVKIDADKICEVCKGKAEGLKAMTGCRFCPITDARKGNNND